MPAELSILCWLLILAGIGSFCLLGMLGQPSFAAQEAFPPTPTPISSPATSIPDSELPSTLLLPFSDPFETSDNWQAQGAWRFDPANGYSDGAWVLDGTQRDTSSTLQLATALDLHGLLNAQLIFRQDGYLPPSDLISVEVSLDGGQTWVLVDQQVGVDAAWQLHSLDLGAFRGQVVRLRFRVSTGTLPPAPDGRVYVFRVDNLAIQFTAIAPEIVVVPVPTVPRTLMGLHLIVGAPKERVIELVRHLRTIGWPLGTLKGTSGTEDILNEVAQISPETVIVFRSLLTPEGMVDCPDISKDPVFEARRWIAGLQPYWQQVPADYYEIMNECQPPASWLVPFSIEAMRMAQAYGQCVLLFSFSAGSPELAYFAELMPAIRYALENPCQPGRYHGIALHAYGVERDRLVSESGLWVGYRHRLLFAEMLAQLPQAGQIPIYLTEVGAGDGHTAFECETIARDVIQYTRQLEYDPYVQGFHLWNLGAQANWIDLTPCLPSLQQALSAYYLARSP